MARPKGAKALGFRCGHPRVHANIVMVSGYERCLICVKAEQARRKAQRVRVERAPRSLTPVTRNTFRCGHPRTGERCLICKNARLRRDYAAQRDRPKTPKSVRHPVPITPPVLVCRVERARSDARLAPARTALLSEAKAAFQQMLADARAAQKGGRPKGSKTNAWHHAAEVEL